MESLGLCAAALHVVGFLTALCLLTLAKATDYVFRWIAEGEREDYREAINDWVQTAVVWPSAVAAAMPTAMLLAGWLWAGSHANGDVYGASVFLLMLVDVTVVSLLGFSCTVMVVIYGCAALCILAWKRFARLLAG